MPKIGIRTQSVNCHQKDFVSLVEFLQVTGVEDRAEIENRFEPTRSESS